MKVKFYFNTLRLHSLRRRRMSGMLANKKRPYTSISDGALHEVEHYENQKTQEVML